MKPVITIAFLTAIVIVAAACQNDSQVEYTRYFTAGAEIYKAHCQNCHGEHGEGLASLIPPLTDTAFIKTNLHKIPCYLQNGLKDEIKVHGKTFSGNMPASGLAPIEIAQVLTYVSNSFGNKAGFTDNTSVAKDLSACK